MALACSRSERRSAPGWAADMAGAVAHAYGWRAAFLALGIPGVIMGTVIYLTIREPARGRLDAVADTGAPPLLESLRFLWRQKAAFMWSWARVCALSGLGSFVHAHLSHAHLQPQCRRSGCGHRTYSLGRRHVATRAPPGSYRAPPWPIRGASSGCCAGVGLTTIPSFVAYWTQSLWIAKSMFWIFIPAIYFYIGPCMGLMQNLAPPRMRAMFTAWSLVVGNVFNLIIAPQGVGLLSDWFAGSRGADAGSLRLALLVLAPTGFWAAYHFAWPGERSSRIRNAHRFM